MEEEEEDAYIMLLRAHPELDLRVLPCPLLMLCAVHRPTRTVAL
jgi:hypothetical protein